MYRCCIDKRLGRYFPAKLKLMDFNSTGEETKSGGVKVTVSFRVVNRRFLQVLCNCCNSCYLTRGCLEIKLWINLFETCLGLRKAPAKRSQHFSATLLGVAGSNLKMVKFNIWGCCDSERFVVSPFSALPSRSPIFRSARTGTGTLLLSPHFPRVLLYISFGSHGNGNACYADKCNDYGDHDDIAS